MDKIEELIDHFAGAVEAYAIDDYWVLRENRKEARVALRAEFDAQAARIKELEKENGVFKELTNNKAEEIIKEITVENDEVHAKLKHPMFALLNMMLSDAWVEDGCQNFYEILMYSPKIGNVIVTFQKIDAKTPAQIISELKNELAALKEALDISHKNHDRCNRDYVLLKKHLDGINRAVDVLCPKVARAITKLTPPSIADAYRADHQFALELRAALNDVTDAQNTVYKPEAE